MALTNRATQNTVHVLGVTVVYVEEVIESGSGGKKNKTRGGKEHTATSSPGVGDYRESRHVKRGRRHRSEKREEEERGTNSPPTPSWGKKKGAVIWSELGGGRDSRLIGLERNQRGGHSYHERLVGGYS